MHIFVHAARAAKLEQNRIMRLTKNDMARVIVTALYNRPALVAADHPEVLRRAARGTVASLTSQHAMAMAAIQSVQKLEQGK